MESVIYFCALMLFFTFVYGYSQYFHEKHRNDPKNLYIPMKSIEKDDIDGFKVGSQTDQSTCDPSAIYKKNGDNSKVCLNGGSCIESGSNTGIYNCSCVEPYIGDNCWSKGAVNQGVKVDITEDFTSPTEITRIPMNIREGQNYFIQYNNYI